MTLFASLILMLLLLLSLSIVFYYSGQLVSVLSGAPFVSMSRADVATLLKLAQLTKQDIVYDLGAGDGRLVIAAAPYVKYATGVEINLAAYLQARATISLKHSSATVIHGSLFDRSYGDATVVFLYLLPRLLKKVEAEIVPHLQPGTRIISKGWPLSSLTPYSINEHIYCYTIL